MDPAKDFVQKWAQGQPQAPLRTIQMHNSGRRTLDSLLNQTSDVFHFITVSWMLEMPDTAIKCEPLAVTRLDQPECPVSYSTDQDTFRLNSDPEPVIWSIAAGLVGFGLIHCMNIMERPDDPEVLYQRPPESELAMYMLQDLHVTPLTVAHTKEAGIGKSGWEQVKTIDAPPLTN